MALWNATEVAVKLGNAVSDPGSSSSTFFAQVATNTSTITAVCKNVEFKEPERTTNEVKLLGSTSGNQNQEIDPQSPGKGEFTGTLILNPDDDNDLDLEKYKLTVHSTKATSYDTRYNYASAEPTNGVAVAVQFNGGSGEPMVNFLLNNASIETLGGFKIDADGHGEQEIRITAAADDCWKEWDLDGGS